MLHSACCPHQFADGSTARPHWPALASPSCLCRGAAALTAPPAGNSSAASKVEQTQNVARTQAPASCNVPSGEALTVTHSLLQPVQEALEHVPGGWQGHAVDADHSWTAGAGAASQQLLIAGTCQCHVVHRQGFACSSAAHPAAMHCRAGAHGGLAALGVPQLVPVCMQHHSCTAGRLSAALEQACSPEAVDDGHVGCGFAANRRAPQECSTCDTTSLKIRHIAGRFLSSVFPSPPVPGTPLTYSAAPVARCRPPASRSRTAPACASRHIRLLSPDMPAACSAAWTRRTCSQLCVCESQPLETQSRADSLSQADLADNMRQL